MGLETGTYISDLNSANPTSTDAKSEGDDHLRLIKSTVKATFPNLTGAVTPTQTELNRVAGVTSAIQTQINVVSATASTAVQSVNSKTGTSITLAKADISLGNVDNTSDVNKPISTATQNALNLLAPINSPGLTGIPTAPTAAASTGTTQIATTAMVQNAIMASSGITATLPGQGGNAGKFLYTNGTSTSWQATPYAANNGTTTTFDQIVANGVAGTGSNARFVAIDSNIELVIEQNGTCFAYSKSGASIGSVVSYRTAGSTYSTSALLIAANTVLIVSMVSGSTAMETVVLTLSGTAITVGTPVATTLAGNATTPIGTLTAVGTSYVIPYGRATTTSALRAITVSGTTPTVGAETALSGATTDKADLVAVTSSVVLAMHCSTALMYATPVTVSGTTLTVGTLASTTATSATTRLYAGAFSSGRYGFVYLNTNLYGAVINVSGTTATISAVQLTTSANITIKAAGVSGNQVLISNEGASALNVNVLTDSSGTAVAGTESIDLGSSYNTSTSGVTAVGTALVGLTGGAGFVGFRYTISGNNPALTTYIITGQNMQMTSPAATGAVMKTATKALFMGTSSGMAISILWDGSAFTAAIRPGINLARASSALGDVAYDIGSSLGTDQRITRLEFA